MLNLSPLTRVFVYSVPADLRRQFDGLAALVKHAMSQDVFAGDSFVFFNRACTLCKVLRWEGDGFSIWAKRLEAGRFQLPPPSGDALSREVDAVTLSLILQGIDLRTAKRRKRFSAPRRDAPPSPGAVPTASSRAIITACLSW
jgi:transposase